MRTQAHKADVSFFPMDWGKVAAGAAWVFFIAFVLASCNREEVERGAFPAAIERTDWDEAERAGRGLAASIEVIETIEKLVSPPQED